MMNERNQVKIGSRVLSKDAFDMLLPNNQEIFNRIENIRKFASESSKYKKKCKNQYISYINREFERNNNNVFSIFGGRGSGKTSVLLTIKNKLTNDIINKNKCDIMMPLIIPENMGESSDILGWVICAFEKVIKDIENYIYSNNDYNQYSNNDYNNFGRFEFFKNCRKNDNNILREKFGQLLKYYTYINKDYRQILNANYDGFKDYKDKTKEIVNAERELLNKFEEFIDILIDVKKYIHKNNEEPLIYIFFDDVDLCTERCLEIINIIQKYLSNQNIVVFVSGDYSTFTETITVNLLKKDGLLEKCEQYFDKEKSIGGRNALDLRKQLAQDILKKVFPPAYRFKLLILNNKAKAAFRFSKLENIDKDNQKEINSEYECLAELIITKLLGKDKTDKDNFLYYNGNLIKIYFNIFDSNPRSLMNIYYFLHQLNNNEEVLNKSNILNDIELYKKENNKKDSEIMRSFLNILIDSNSQLGNISEEVILDVIDIKDNLKDTFINYDYIREIYNNDFEESNNIQKEKLNKYINLFLLAHFMENIIISKIEDRNVHGIDILIEIINLSNKNKLIPKYNDIKFILALYSKVDEDLGKINLNKFTTYDINYFTKKYFEILFDSFTKEVNKEKVIDEEKLIDVFLGSIRKQDKWAEEKIDIVFKATSTEKELFYSVINRVYDEYIKNLDCDTISKINKSIQELKNDFDEIENNGVINEYRSIEMFKFDKKYEKEFLVIMKIIQRNLALNEIITEIKNKIEDVEDILKHNFINGIVYKMEWIFIKSFNEIFKDFSYKDAKNINNELRRIDEIIESSNGMEINKTDYNELSNILRALRMKTRREHGVIIPEKIDFLYRIVRGFDCREVVLDEDVEELESLIIENIILKFSLEFFKRKKYIYENKKSYNKFKLIKNVLKQSKYKRLGKIINDKQKELIELKIEEDRDNVQ